MSAMLPGGPPPHISPRVEPGLHPGLETCPPRALHPRRVIAPAECHAWLLRRPFEQAGVQTNGGAVGQDAGMANLGKIDHIVVLMLENRSFDHMLGYLSLEGGRNDIDGLRPEFANEHDGHGYPVHHLDCTAIADDPDHSSAAVDLQVGGGAMDGFAASYAATLASRGIKDGDPGRVLGYYNADDVPVYDHLARQFAVCDRWFSSVPGATWPNRLYAICGRAAGSRDDLPRNMPPLYNQPSFVRHLDAHGISWRWYSFEAAGTLRFADAHYALGHHDRFAFFSRTKMNWKSRLERVDADAASFLEDAARGQLPAGAWIDPI